MAAELIIAGRRPLPPRARPWTLELRTEAGVLVLYENDEDFKSPAPGGSEVGDTVGWKPVVVVRIRRAWERAYAVAEVLAAAVEGSVFSDVDWEVCFDAKGRSRKYETLASLEAALNEAFENPQPLLDRWAAEEQDREAGAAAADWSEF